MDLAIWMGPRDLEGRSPTELIDFAQSCTLNPWI